MCRYTKILVVAIPLLAQDPSVRLERVTGGLAAPTDVQHAGDGTGRLFVVEQGGRIRIVREGVLAARPFLDISARTVADGEQGLLGLAFPPDFRRKQHFYVNYTDRAGDTIIARYRVTTDPDLADPASETIVLQIEQPFSNHNGGGLQFGPDGRLYIGMGDGGSGNDPGNYAQRADSLLGKMLRWDVEAGAAAPSIWARGLRNPWRFSFDRASGDLWIADVGQDNYEEVNFQPASSQGGENYGWRMWEGLHCANPPCEAASHTAPVAEYTHEEGCSVTGGYVYRGRRSPGLRGMYFYGDYCSGRLWGLRREGDRWRSRLAQSTGLNISTFGQDEAGELYVADHGGGVLYGISGNPAPALSAAGVVDAASFAPGLVAGSAATIFAFGVLDSDDVVAAGRTPLPLELAGVSVTIANRPAPLYAVANRRGLEQVNVQTPWEAAGATSAAVVVRREGLASAPVTVAVLAAQPGVFTLDGEAAVVVHHSDNALVTPERPAERGEIVYLYATGLGPLENTPPTGAAAPLAPLSPVRGLVSATIGGRAAEVLFAGLAPGLAGVYQINLRVPTGVPAGLADLIVQSGGLPSRVTRLPVR